MNRPAGAHPQRERAVTTFGMIRHAETVWNREKRIQGHRDSPLTPEGERMADRWGLALRAFDWDRILASDTGRAVETARRINAHLRLPLETDPRLRELDWGCWASKTVAQLRQEESDLLDVQERAGWDFQPPQGEWRRSQLKRTGQALLAAAGRYPGQFILVVTHAGAIKCLAWHLSGHRWSKADDIGKLRFDGLDLPLCPKSELGREIRGQSHAWSGMNVDSAFLDQNLAHALVTGSRAELAAIGA